MTKSSTSSSNGLRKIPPYWYAYTTMAKGRWLGRKILEVVSSEFRDRSMDFYRYALESGVTTINGVVAKPDTIVRNGDRIENVVHRHEPPVTDKPVKLLLHNPEREFIVVEKPGSIPVHPAGRYFKNTLVEILQTDFGFSKVYTVNRLDRLTSGLMILPTSPVRANELTQEFFNGLVGKEYIARCKGKFPKDEVVCEEPLLTVDRQMGLNIVHPEGKPAKTVFNLIHYDSNSDTSVVHCKPLTGRSHQIRVHLQYLGHPIANDPVYSETKIWGEKLGKGGLDLTPSDERSAPQAPPQFQFTTADNPEALSSRGSDALGATGVPDGVNGSVNTAAPDTEETSTKLLPRETGHDIGLASPVPLSAEAVKVITGLRNMKDEDEDWSRWRDVVFRAKTALVPKIEMMPLPPQNKRKRGGRVELAKEAKLEGPPPASEPGSDVQAVEEKSCDSVAKTVEFAQDIATDQLTTEEAMAKLKIVETVQTDHETTTEVKTEEMHYCPECYLPIHPDPKPERLYIFLHALKYTTSLGSFQTEMPEWAAVGWEWDRS
ncbi:pseudouridine synthase [Cristinia sonorae]|uniref:Pseudouridine synthase n=1 Tax=Cristinia sonorae TaxID=1940300 RepID=A0A8K0UK35_9AGAR|nr:pseudouridine synthase [Cristinia sonorae]